MNTVIAPAFSVRIYLSGPQNVIEQECRKSCFHEGLCVTVTPTKFIYTGGEETGCVVGLLNYPRFPTTKKALCGRAIALATQLLLATYQHSALVVTEDETLWISNRDDEKAGAP